MMEKLNKKEEFNVTEFIERLKGPKSESNLILDEVTSITRNNMEKKSGVYLYDLDNSMMSIELKKDMLRLRDLISAVKNNLRVFTAAMCLPDQKFTPESVEKIAKKINEDSLNLKNQLLKIKENFEIAPIDRIDFSKK